MAEKESGLYKNMISMGMSRSAYWLSWLVHYSLVNLLVSALVAAVLTLAVFKHTQGILLFFLIFTFGESLFGLAMLS